MKGAYLLVLEMKTDSSVRIGALGTMVFNKGWYVYVGSAMNGLEQRLQRHLRKQKKIHWHIDYLLQHASLHHIFYKEHHEKEECSIATFCRQSLEIIPGFGCSDCRCPSHLFTGSYENIMCTLSSLSLTSYPIRAQC